MRALPSSYGSNDEHVEEHYRVTRRGVVERLADPYLTEHDRWVLHQFAQFLAGVAPGPDPRVTPTVRPPRPLYPRVRRATL